MSWLNFFKSPKPEPDPPLTPEEKEVVDAIKQAVREVRLLVKAIRKMSPEEKEVLRKLIAERQKTTERINNHVDD